MDKEAKVRGIVIEKMTDRHVYFTVTCYQCRNDFTYSVDWDGLPEEAWCEDEKSLEEEQGEIIDETLDKIEEESLSYLCQECADGEGQAYDRQIRSDYYHDRI